MRGLVGIFIVLSCAVLSVVPAQAALNNSERAAIADYVSQLNGCAARAPEAADGCAVLLEQIQRVLDIAQDEGRITADAIAVFETGALNAVIKQYPAGTDLPVFLTSSAAYQQILASFATAGDTQTCDVVVASATDLCGL